MKHALLALLIAAAIGGAFLFSAAVSIAGQQAN